MVIFDALLRMKHVTRAAEELFMTQLAVSAALKQLRIIFEDYLLVKGFSNKLMLTHKAKSLWELVYRVVQHVSDVFTEKKPITPADAEISFNHGLSDYVYVVFFPKLIHKITKQALGVSVNVLHVNDLV